MGLQSKYMALGRRCRMAVTLGLALASMLTAEQKRETLYDRFEIDAGDWRYFEFPAKEKGARLLVHFEVQWPADSAGVRAAILTADEFHKLRQNLPHREIASSGYRRAADLRTRLADTGGYAVVIDSRLEGRRKYRVEMEVNLITGPDPETLPVTYVSPQKRRAIVAASIAGFLAILALAGQALWRATRFRPRPSPPPPPLWS